MEALRNLEHSVDLNEYRAVYRDRAQLDSDLAARTANIGKTYRDLQFEQLALLEGARSTAVAPDDYAGHRLLADVFGALPRHEEARVSEALQAQLLQPLSHQPVQPLLAQTRLLAPAGLMPSAPGDNEYSVLYQRDGGTVQASGIVGDHGLRGDELLGAVLSGNVALSAAQFHYENDPMGNLPGQDQDILTAFAQFQPTQSTSVQAEIRSGGVNARQTVVGTAMTENSDVDERTGRLGLTHRWSPEATLMASVIWQTSDERLTQDGQSDPSDPFSRVRLYADSREEGVSAEVRQDWRWNGLRLTGGVSYYDAEATADIAGGTEWSGQVGDPPMDGVMAADFGVHTTRDVQMARAYLYGWRDFSDSFALNFGLSYDTVDRSGVESQTTSMTFRPIFPPIEIPLAQIDQETDTGKRYSQWNPKLGVVWQPWKTTTMRAAAFRSLYRVGPLRQTIEPTHVAGFSQMFDGQADESFWRYGVGLDHAFSRDLKGGLEWSKREREFVSNMIGGGEFVETRNEKTVRAYAYWTVTPRFAAGLEYFYEANVLGGDRTDDVTHRLPLSLSYFHPSGWFGRLTTSYVDQSGYWLGKSEARGDERFWNCDVQLGYRLPRRLGHVALQVNNLFDENMDYRETDYSRPLFVPERTVALRAALYF